MQVSLLTATAPVPAGLTVAWILVTEEQTQRSQWTQEPIGSRSVRLVTNVQVGRPCIRATTSSPLLSFCVNTAPLTFSYWQPFVSENWLLPRSI